MAVRKRGVSCGREDQLRGRTGPRTPLACLSLGVCFVWEGDTGGTDQVSIRLMCETSRYEASYERAVSERTAGCTKRMERMRCGGGWEAHALAGRGARYTRVSWLATTSSSCFVSASASAVSAAPAPGAADGARQRVWPKRMLFACVCAPRAPRESCDTIRCDKI